MEDSHYTLEQNDMGTYELNLPYERSGRSSYSSDPSEPTTPSSVNATPYQGVRDAVDLEPVYEFGEESYYDARSAIYPSLAGSTTADTDDDRFASSVFLATPVDSKPFYYQPNAEYMDGYRTQKIYSPSSTSAYSVAEALRSKFSDDSDSAETLDDFPPTSPNYGGWSEASPQRPRSRPIDIQPSRDGPRHSAAKSHNIFNPMRFFPRSSGSSWLNPKSSNHGNRPIPPSSNDRTRQFSPPSGASTHWASYYHSHTAPKGGRDSRYPARGFSYQTRLGREWIP